MMPKSKSVGVVSLWEVSFDDKCAQRVFESLGLWVGDQHARDAGFINREKITHIVDATNTHLFEENSSITYLCVDIDDVPTAKFDFEQTNAFIDAALNANGQVLVHCSAGISRSPTIVAAYLIWKFSWSKDQALKHLQQIRACVDPNPAFLKQLRDFEKKSLQAKRSGSASPSPTQTPVSPSAKKGFFS